MKYSAFLIKLSASLLEEVVHLDLKICVSSALGSFTFTHAVLFFFYARQLSNLNAS